MKIFIVVISLGLASARFLVSDSVMHVIYGDIGRMRDLAVPPEGARPQFNYVTQPTNARRSMAEEPVPLPTFDDLLGELEVTPSYVKLNHSGDIDMKHFNEVMAKLLNVKKSVKEVMKDETSGRRQMLNMRKFSTPPSEVDALYANPVQLREWYYEKLCLTFIIHIRFQVDAAIRYKMASMNFRGYKVGYLFHRLKSIKVMMYRIYDEQRNLRPDRQLQNRPNWRTKKHSLALILEWYQRMLNLDVDSKDTIDLIRNIYYRRPAFLTQEVSQSTPIKL